MMEGVAEVEPEGVTVRVGDEDRELELVGLCEGVMERDMLEERETEGVIDVEALPLGETVRVRVLESDTLAVEESDREGLKEVEIEELTDGELETKKLR